MDTYKNRYMETYKNPFINIVINVFEIITVPHIFFTGEATDYRLSLPLFEII